MEITLNLKTVICSRATRYLSLQHTHINMHVITQKSPLCDFKENFSLVRQSVNQQIQSHTDRELEANEERERKSEKEK